MTNHFVWVSWNRHKRVYDAVLLLCVGLYLAVFLGVSAATAGADGFDPLVALIRATGSLAIVMLHVILCLGPIARLTDRAAPLLYNRRHFGVLMFLVGLLHGALVLLYYGGFGAIDPITAVFLSGRSFGSVAAFPYELLGLAGLLVLFVMAATSHDFWLDLLGPSVWKWIHMSVYGAYALVVGHVAVGSLARGGVLDDDGSGVRLVALGCGVVLVAGLHLLTGLRELMRDEMGKKPIEKDDRDPSWAGWIEVGSVDEILEDRAKVVSVAGGERVAVFRHGGCVSAVSNVCAHQGGPLGEGKIVDGCVTCPWHGYQFRVEDGRSPAPYTEKIPTYRLRVEGRTVLLDPNALPAGTPVEPVFFEASPADPLLFEDPDVDQADSAVDRAVELTADGVVGGADAGADVEVGRVVDGRMTDGREGIDGR